MSDVSRQEESVAPEVNICETSDGYVLEAEMPGVSKDGLEISVEGTEIVIMAKAAIGTLRIRKDCG